MSRYLRLTLPLRILKRSLVKFYEDDGSFLARGLAYGLLIYCIPLALLLVSALSYTIASSDRALTWIRSVAAALVPRFQDEFTTYLSEIVSRRGLLGVVGFVSFVFVSSATWGSARLVLNKVFRTPESRGILHGKAMEMVMTVATSALFFVMIVAVYALSLIQSFLASLPFTQRLVSALESEFPGVALYVHPTTIAVARIGTFLATVFLFWFLYRFSPAKSLHRPSLMAGAVTAAALFEASKAAFASYVDYVQGTSAFYGTLSGFVFFVAWLYYASAVFVFGAEVSWAVEHRREI